MEQDTQAAAWFEEDHSSSKEPHRRKIATTAKEGKYLTFALGAEEYGIGILKVKEIIGTMAITSVPQSPPWIKGVINLRGKVIPVADLRQLFNMAFQEYTDRTCIIIVEIEGDGREMIIGVVVDTVSEVLTIKKENIEDTPTFGSAINTEYILGMAKIDHGVKILLDIDMVLNQPDVPLPEKAP